MSDGVHWVLELNVKDGRVDDFKSLAAEMVAATQANEPGTLIYEYFLSADEKAVNIYERYVDSAATLVHLGTFGEKFAERFLDILEPTRFTVYGNPNAEVRGVLDGFGAQYMGEVVGFAR